ncbi:RNA-directed DNA polymerase, eukaryota [Tanacetum coccineum]
MASFPPISNSSGLNYTDRDLLEKNVSLDEIKTEIFYLASGLKINIYKSNVYGVGVSEEESRTDLGACNSAYLLDLLNEMSHIDIASDSDACIWSLANDGVFSVGLTRQHLDDHILPSLDTLTFWDKALPHKVNIIMWRLKLDRLPHQLNLSACGIEISEISCPSCNGNFESNLHIFFELILLETFGGLFEFGATILSLRLFLTTIG